MDRWNPSQAFGDPRLCDWAQRQPPEMGPGGTGCRTLLGGTWGAEQSGAVEVDSLLFGGRGDWEGKEGPT